MLLGTYEDEPIRFDPWEIAWMHDYSRIRVCEKAPQIGFSWISAAEAEHECIMLEDAATGFVSVTQDEAKNKILYARKLYEGLPSFIQDWVPICSDSVESLEFGVKARPGQILSFPATSALRGRKMNVVADEAEFYKDGGLGVLRIAVGRIARGPRLTFGSTVFGIDTAIDRLMSGMDRSGNVLDDTLLKVSKARFPWSVITNPEQLMSVELAYDLLDPDDFAEEYECVRAGGASDPFPAEMIREATHDLELEDITTEEKNGNVIIEFTDPQAMMVAGYDIGKGTGKHPSILSLCRLEAAGFWVQIALHSPHKANAAPLDLPAQEGWLIDLLTRCPNLRLVPDATGLGAHIVQSLVRRFGERRIIAMQPGSRPRGLKPQDKDELVTDLRRALEAKELFLMHEKEQAQQFHRTKKKGGHYTQMGTSRRSHFDKFWATAYAQYGIAVGGRLESAYSRHGLVVVGMEGLQSA